MLKKRIWLIENEEMQEMSPKEFYSETFKEIVQEIRDNKKRIRRIVISPICNAKNLRIN